MTETARTARALVVALTLGLFLFSTALCHAQSSDAAAAAASLTTAPAPAAAKIDTGDTAWMLVSSGLVLMMTGPGLALFYSGLVRRKNVLATMMQSFILMAIVSIIWAVVGYSLAFDVGNPFFGGMRFAGLREVFIAPSEYASTIPHNRSWFMPHTRSRCSSARAWNGQLASTTSRPWRRGS